MLRKQEERKKKEERLTNKQARVREKDIEQVKDSINRKAQRKKRVHAIDSTRGPTNCLVEERCSEKAKIASSEMHAKSEERNHTTKHCCKVIAGTVLEQKINFYGGSETSQPIGWTVNKPVTESRWQSRQQSVCARDPNVREIQMYEEKASTKQECRQFGNRSEC